MRAPIKLNRGFWPRTLSALLPSATDPRILAKHEISESDFTEAVSTLRFGRTYKTTRTRRFPQTIAHLATLRYGAPPVIVDVGASDGVTSLDVMQAVPHARYYVTDAHISVLTSERGATRYFYAANGECILISDGAWIFYPDVERAIPPLGAVARRRFRSAPTLDARAEPITLINPRVKSHPSGDVRIERYDVLEPWAHEKADVVIAANILNRAYFTGAQLALAVRHLAEALKEGGRLAVIENRANHTQDAEEVEQSSIFRRSGDTLRVEHRIGVGSDIESLVERSGSLAAERSF